MHVMDLNMKIQYKNRTYKQTNWPCCDCMLAEWKQGLIDCPSFIKMNCYKHGFKRKLFNDQIFKL